MLENPDIRDDRGLYVRSLSMAPGASTVAPAPSDGAGQYVIVVKGTLLHDDRSRNALTVVFNAPHEAPFRIQAGPDGLEALIVNFPRPDTAHGDAKSAATATGFRKWRCVLCGFVYDEALGLPNEGFVAGTRWADVPDNWMCGDCGAGKGDFEMVEI